MSLEDGILLYHGSYVGIDEIDLNKGTKSKDFGQGFYLTSNEKQAISFISTSLLKAKASGDAFEEQNYGYVTTFKYRKDASLDIYEFDTADKEWLWFISQNRRRAYAGVLRDKIDTRVFDADIIIGKIANDTTNPVITAYLNGLFGDVESDTVCEDVIKRLLPNRLEKQFCFVSEKSISRLELVEVKRYEL